MNFLNHMLKSLNKLIRESFEISTDDFSEDTELSEFIQDDVDMLVFVEELSSSYGVVVDDKTADSWKTLADVVTTVEELGGASSDDD